MMVAVVVFITILKLAKSGADLNFSSILMLFGQEAMGLLWFIDWLYWIQTDCSIDNDQVEVLITLAIVMEVIHLYIILMYQGLSLWLQRANNQPV
jgi:CPA1 family monovalent cation:H+ antiporter